MNGGPTPSGADCSKPSPVWVWPAAAQAFPNRPLRMVVPFPAGGPTDLVARPLAHLLSLSLHQQVIIDNKGGAGGSIAADGVAKSVPDGGVISPPGRGAVVTASQASASAGVAARASRRAAGVKPR